MANAKTGLTLMCALFSAFAHADTQGSARKEWQALFGAEKMSKVESTCNAFLKSSDKDIQSEAHQCLFNVEVKLSGNKDSTRLKRAFDHINQAAELTPGDVNVHKGRMSMLLSYGFADQAVTVLEKSIAALGAKSNADMWLPYVSKLSDMSLLKTGVAFFKAVDKHYPNDFRILANIGALYSSLKDEEQNAIEYFRKAEKLNPNDLNNLTNFAEIMDRQGKTPEAEGYFVRALKVAEKGHDGHAVYCLYAVFAKNKLKDQKKSIEAMMHCQGGGVPLFQEP